MSIIFFISILILTAVLMELLMDRAVTFSGVAYKDRKAKHFWYSIMVQAGLALGCMGFSILNFYTG